MKNKVIIIFLLLIFLVICSIYVVYLNNGQSNNMIENSIELNNKQLANIKMYEMSEDDIVKLPTTEIIAQNPDEEKNIEEQMVEPEEFELQGNIAYEGDKAETWNVELGNYTGLTYYSQIDSRWKNIMYSSKNDSSQTIGTSGCGPAAAAIIVTSTKGAITPEKMASLFVKYGYRSSNSGTYWSAFRAIADEFNIEYQETTNLDKAISLLKNNNYVVASVGNGLFTTGGHFIVLVGIEGDNLKIYDPYLYSGKFDTSTRRGKVTISGNNVYCSINNFKKYANYRGFFAYKHDEKIQENNKTPIKIEPYTRYVDVNSSLNIRNAPNGNKVGSLKDDNKVTVYETSGDWSRIGENKWVYSEYLTTNNSSNDTNSKYSTGNYKVTASVLKVRTGAGTNYSAKSYNQLSENAKKQNRQLGNYYTNGYKNGVVCTVTKVVGNWGYTNSGWICLDYCRKV